MGKSAYACIGTNPDMQNRSAGAVSPLIYEADLPAFPAGKKI